MLRRTRTTRSSLDALTCSTSQRPHPFRRWRFGFVDNCCDRRSGWLLTQRVQAAEVYSSGLSPGSRSLYAAVRRLSCDSNWSFLQGSERRSLSRLYEAGAPCQSAIHASLRLGPLGTQRRDGGLSATSQATALVSCAASDRTDNRNTRLPFPTSITVHPEFSTLAGGKIDEGKIG